MTARTLRLEYSLPDASLRGNSRAHWAQKHRAAKKMRDDATWIGLIEGIDHTYAKAKITYHFFHWRLIDLDNLAGSGMKSFQDGLQDSRVIPNDDPDHVVPGEHTFTKCAKGESRVEVVVEEIL
jgi:hypothetical protein